MWAEAGIMKADAETGESVPGATLQLIDYLGNVCDEWESTNEPHSFDKFESGREYTLHEKKAPAGYLPTEDITISISKNGVVTSSGTITDGVILMEDKQTELSISKREVGGDSELEGARLTLRADSENVTLNNVTVTRDGDAVETVLSQDGRALSFTSGKSSTLIEKITAGDYTLIEETAPDGYTVQSEIAFTVNDDGTVTVDGKTVEGVLVEDTLTKVSVSKKSAANDEELAGAEMTLTGTADWEKVFAASADDAHQVELIGDETNGYTGIKWISTDQELTVTGLTTGEEYLLEETGAPDGYIYADDMRFVLESGENGSTVVKVYSEDTGSFEVSEAVEMIDEQTSVTLFKADKETDEALGNAVFSISDENGEVLSVTVPEGGCAVTGKLNTGVEYTLHEVTPPDGYETAEDITFIINEDGSLVIDGEAAADKTITVHDAAISIDDGRGGRGDGGISGDEDGSSGDEGGSSGSGDDGNESSPRTEDDDNSNGSGNSDDSNGGARGSDDSGSGSGRSSDDSNGTGSGNSSGNPGTGAAGTLAAVSAALTATVAVSRRKSRK